MWLHCLLMTQFSLTPLILEVCPLFRQDYLITTLSNHPFLSLSFSHLWPPTPYQLGSYPMFSKEHLKWIARERTRSTWMSLCPSPWALSANVCSAAYGPSLPLDIILGCRSLRGKTHGGNHLRSNHQTPPWNPLHWETHHLRAAHWCVVIAYIGLEMPLRELRSSFVAFLPGITQNRSLGLQVFAGSHQSPLVLSFFWDK